MGLSTFFLITTEGQEKDVQRSRVDLPGGHAYGDTLPLRDLCAVLRAAVARSCSPRSRRMP